MTVGGSPSLNGLHLGRCTNPNSLSTSGQTGSPRAIATSEFTQPCFSNSSELMTSLFYAMHSCLRRMTAFSQSLLPLEGDTAPKLEQFPGPCFNYKNNLKILSGSKTLFVYFSKNVKCCKINRLVRGYAEKRVSKAIIPSQWLISGQMRRV